MSELDQSGVYPNPSTSREWTDGNDRLWHRRGERGEALDAKRTRSLLRKNGLPLVTWAAGTISWFDSPEEKERAAGALYEAGRWPEDVFAVEWKSDEGEHLLMLEHHC